MTLARGVTLATMFLALSCVERVYFHEPAVVVAGEQLQ